MSSLSGAQRKYLRGLAHGLKPVVQVGRRGLTAAVVEEADAALERHELIKVRLAGDREERRVLAEELARRLSASLVGTIGAVAILYRRHPDPEKRTIRLPG